MKSKLRPLPLALSLAVLTALPCPAQWDGLSSFEQLPDLAFPEIVANGTGDGMLSDLCGTSVLVVVIGLDATQQAWALATRILKKADQLEERSVRLILWINRSQGRDVDVEVLRRWPWLTATVVAGKVAFTSDPQVWALGPDGRRLRRLQLIETMADEFDALVESASREAGRRRIGWGEDKPLRRARALAYGKGRLADARSIALSYEPPSAEAEERRDALLGELDELFLKRLRRIKHDVHEGRWGRAKEACEQLAHDVRGWEPKEDVALETLRPLDDKDARAHLMIDRNIARWMKRLRASGPNARLADEIRRIISRAPEGAVKDRGRRLLALVTRATERSGGE